MRAFIALELPDAARAAIAAVADSLRPRLPGVRWASPETMHLTLRFLGDATAAQIEQLRAPLAAAVAACPERELRVAGLGLFPERGPARVVWMGTALPDGIVTLQRDCEAAAAAAGFVEERKAFRSHITLGRWRTPARRPTLPTVDLGVVPLAALVLFKSTLDPGGAIHEPLERFELGG